MQPRGTSLGLRAAADHDRERDFVAAHIAALREPPSPRPRAVLYTVSACIASAVAAIAFGEIDRVAVAPGKLIPQTYLRVVQPAESGVVREILTREGESVSAGQLLFRMDTRLSEADRRILDTEVVLRRLQLRRIDAELEGGSFERRPGERAELFAQVEAQFIARRRAFGDTLEAERSVLAKAREDMKGAEEVESKLKRTAPIYREQEQAWEQLAREGFAGRLLALERRRNRIENEQDLQAQSAAVSSARAAIAVSERRIGQLTSGYRRELSNERVEVLAQLERLQEDAAKHAHRSGQLELRAPSDGVIKDIATHSTGTVVAPGTILATIVPNNEPLEAEVWLNNLDVGQVNSGAQVRLKLAAYPYQHFGMLDGVVRHISADATERPEPGSQGGIGLYYRVLISIDGGRVPAEIRAYRLVPGMQLAAEIHGGTRTLLDYLIAPLRKTVSEAGREH